MKLLQKLIFASGLLSLMAATSDDALRKNQLAVASQVYCGIKPGTNEPLKWTHDEFLGNVGGKPVYTIIHQNRIYIRWDGNPDQSRKNEAFENTAILLHMDNNKFPNNTEGNRVVNACINSIDPSTMGNNYLGTQQGNMIPCNNKPITDGLMLGTYKGGDGVRTFQYAIIKDGLLRVNFHRETNGYSRDAISMGLIRQTLEGENGSFMNPNMGFSLNYNEVLSCFWNELPKNPDSVVNPEPNCPGGPTLGTITNISQTALRFSYSGNGIPNIDWRIKSGNNVLRSGKTGNLSSTNVDISFGSMAAGNYTLEIEGGDCASSVSSQAFTINQANCPSGPSISNVRNVSPTGITVDFNGSGVPNLTWRVKQSGNVVRNGKTGNLSSNSASISFNSLGAGTYSIEIEGGDCLSSVSTSNFTVVPGSCPGGPSLGTISNISASGLRFQFDGNGVPNITWRIKSGADVVRNGKTPGLTSSLVDISFATLGGGNYTLEIEGGDCISTVSSKTFSVGSTNCASGPSISGISNVSATGLTFNFNGVGVSTVTWRVKQNGNTVASGKTGTLSSNSAAITFGSLGAGGYTLEIEGGNCTSAVSSSNFTVSTPNCASGPTISGLRNVSASGLTVDFNAVGVSNITWRVKQSGNVIRNGKTGNLGSNSAALSFATLSAGTYSIEIEGGDCVSSVSSSNFTINPGTCPGGPTLGTISNISASGLRFQFDGNGVPNITWRIKSGADVVRNGKTPGLTSSLVDISFATLAGGNYTLEIEGGDCISTVSSKTFSVGSTNCASGPSISGITGVSATGLTFNFNGVGVSTVTWRVKLNGNTVANGKTGTLSSNSAAITFASLAASNYSLEIEGGNCTSAVSASNFTIATPNCASGPAISGLRNVSASGLTVDFNAVGVSNITWRVKQSGNIIRNGKTGNLTSNSAALSFATLGAGTYSLEIEGGNCVSSVSSSNFTINAGTCPAGPTLGTISNISVSALRFQFDGNGVPNITWRVKSGADVVRNGKTPGLTSSLVDISFATLGGGTYTLEIEGGDCVSTVSSKTFSIGSTNCASGPSISGITNVSATGLTFNFNGVGVSTVTWRVKLSGNVLASGKTGTLSSNSAAITFASLAAGNYSLEIEGGNCTSTVSTSNFTVATPNCASGPSISGLRNVSASGLTVDFNGVGVPNITWRVKQSGNVIRNGKTGNLTSNSAALTFATLGAGTYSLEIQGGDCVSTVSTSNFTINAGTCPGGPTLGTISNISASGLRFQFDGNGVPNITWRIKSGADVVRNGKTPGLTSSLVDISFAALGGGTYTLEIEGGDCVSTVSSKTFSIGSTNCASGPTISGIANVSATGLTVNFNGVGVSSVTWRIKQGGAIVANGTTGNLSSNSAAITFAALNAGSYSLEIQGGNCVSTVSSSTFNVTTVDNRLPCEYGPILKSVYNQTETGLIFNFHGNNVSSIDWKIMQGNTVMRSARVNLTSDRPQISFAALERGDYTLQIEGGSCKSTVQTMAFKIDAVLPIYIARFAAAPAEEGVELSWNVTEEQNGKGFEVIRYDNQVKVPNVIGELPLSDKRVGEYKFVDKSPVYGNNYYQLKMVDQDGKFLSSRIVTVRYEAITGAFVSPNPVRDVVNVEFISKSAGKGRVETYNISGIKLNSAEQDVVEGKNTMPLNVTGLNEGHYFLKVYYGNQEMNMRFFKVR
ncbi:T9SS type A sorting domain-containing protein [Dyadobacter chenhuakuii]|uniref:T9SS type A sorting domain-containing protein n=1 Tax=Dyadobacter chenhuakuii TaxID=2909339 RepID=A0A9X1Q9H4_9BACT|nr:T9SS type A sorting domain-containing protein [Dyadobacter chenhuakuii]MCF2497610.1 T9SS type A sorting domain-containing protein [Dyadobacter chenhuakuii]